MSKNKKDEVAFAPVRMIREQEFAYTNYDVRVPPGTTQNDLTQPDAWVHVARRLKRGDELRCFAADGSFVLYLIVMFVEGTQVRVKVVNSVDLGDTEAKQSDNGNYEVFHGGAGRWYVRVVADGSKLFEGKPFGSREEAAAALEEFEGRLAA